jgi:hypothetical protein
MTVASEGFQAAEPNEKTHGSQQIPFLEKHAGLQQNSLKSSLFGETPWAPGRRASKYRRERKFKPILLAQPKATEGETGLSNV